nr:B3 domain-containing protein, DNA-binding pseudobarrel domain protein [Tanacetum cinerariifolium]
MTSKHLLPRGKKQSMLDLPQELIDATKSFTLFLSPNDEALVTKSSIINRTAVDRGRVNKKNRTKRVECEEAKSSHANEQLQIICWDPLADQHNEPDKKKRRIRPKVECGPVVKNEFVEENKDYLKELSMIQIWSFREDQQLCFALAVVDRPPLYLMASNGIA